MHVYKKYSDGADSQFLNFIKNQSAPAFPTSRGSLFLEEQAAHLVHASLAATAWKKYSTWWNCFEAFEVFSRNCFSWPLSEQGGSPQLYCVLHFGEKT